LYRIREDGCSVSAQLLGCDGAQARSLATLETPNHREHLAQAGTGFGGGEAGEFATDLHVIAGARENEFSVARFHLGDFPAGRGELDLRHREQIFRGLGQDAKAIAPRLANRVELLLGGDLCKFAIGLDARLRLRNIGAG